MSNDLISREALRKAMRKSINERYKHWDKRITVADIATLIFDEIDNAPTVFDDKAYSDGYTQGTCDCEHAHERPQGEWKETGYETGALGITYRQTQCSNCGWEHALPMWWNFCPNCGAKMQKGGTENDTQD